MAKATQIVRVYDDTFNYLKRLKITYSVTYSKLIDDIMKQYMEERIRRLR